MRNKKIKLYSIGNDEKFNYYTFDKKEEVMETLAKLFRDFFETFWELDNVKKNKRREYSSKKVNIEKFKDIHWGERGKKGSRVDVFFGDKLMFVSVHCSEKLRLKFNEKLLEISVMPKPKKIKGKLK